MDILKSADPDVWQAIAHEAVRVAYGKSHRAAVQDLTGQRHVPVLVLDGEAIADSKRIVEHLRWRAGAGD